MSLLEKIFAKSRLVDELMQRDLHDKSPDRKACLENIDRLNKELSDLPLKELAKAEKAVAEATLRLESARLEYNTLSAQIENKRRKLLADIRKEEKRMHELMPLVLHQAINSINEKTQQAGVLSVAKSNMIDELLGELRALARVVDDKTILERVADVEKKIDNALSLA